MVQWETKDFSPGLLIACVADSLLPERWSSTTTLTRAHLLTNTYLRTYVKCFFFNIVVLCVRVNWKMHTLLLSTEHECMLECVCSVYARTYMGNKHGTARGQQSPCIQQHSQGVTLFISTASSQLQLFPCFLSQKAHHFRDPMLLGQKLFRVLWSF